MGQGSFTVLKQCEWPSLGVPSNGSDNSYPTGCMSQAHKILNAMGIIFSFTWQGWKAGEPCLCYDSLASRGSLVLS